MRAFFFGAAVLLSAFLLFIVQPLTAKVILPWFGGTPALWTTCMMFFQVVLLAGYAYAHGVASMRGIRRQVIIHGVVLLLAVAALPIVPTPEWKPVDGEQPVLRIVGILAANVGIPYFVLAATGPLLQAWFAGIRTGRDPYRLYALSNAGSFAALLAYPVCVEPWLRVPVQAWWWSALFVFFAVLCGAVSWVAWRASDGAGAQQEESRTAVLPPVSFMTRAYWFACAACGSLLLLAGTNQISQDVAVVPMIWIVPLALYLLTFILCFRSPRGYRRPFYFPLYALLAVATLWAIQGETDTSFAAQMVAYPAMVFAGCMICHGEMVRVRPPARQLTEFYLMMAAGGAAGGIFAAIVAPLVLNRLVEFEVGIAGAGALFLWGWGMQEGVALFRGRRRLVFAVCALVVILLACAGDFVLRGYRVRRTDDEDGRWWSWNLRHPTRTVLERTRNFYGTLLVYWSVRHNNLYHTLVHGRIIHGGQFTDGPRRCLPLTYYGTNTGVAAAINCHPRKTMIPPAPLHIGVVGLGVGTMAAYAESNEVIRFYEINPDVIRLAKEYFTYLEDSPAATTIVRGDARISLEWERDTIGSRQYDVLVVDAFSGDAIPVHLLTRECFDLYWSHMRPDGVAAFHITNQFIDLEPVLRAHASRRGLMALEFENDEDKSTGSYDSTWMLVTANTQLADALMALPGCTNSLVPGKKVIEWTDDYSSLLRSLHSKR